MKEVTNVGKKIFSCDRSLSGIITHEPERYCAVCRKTHKCYIVKWENGTCTKPCEKAVERINDNELIIKG